MDYISNLVNPQAFNGVVSKLNENSSFAKMSAEQKEIVLQRMAANRPQKPALAGSTDSVNLGEVSLGTGGGSGGGPLDPSGIALGGSSGDDLIGLGEDAALGGAVGTAAAMGLGGLDLGDALGIGMDVSTMGQSVLGGIPSIFEKGLGVAQDLGFTGKVGKGILSIALTAVNPALGAVAGLMGGTVADAAMDFLGIRDLEDQKERLEEVAGELGARSNIDYGSLEGLDDIEGDTFGEMRDNYKAMMDAGVETQSISRKEAAEMAQKMAALDQAATFEDKTFTTREYSLEKTREMPNVDLLGQLADKLRGHGVDPDSVPDYEPLGTFDSILGAGAYDEAVSSAQTRTQALQDSQKAGMMGISNNELDERREVAEREGIDNLTGEEITRAMVDNRGDSNGSSGGDIGGGGSGGYGSTANQAGDSNWH